MTLSNLLTAVLALSTIVAALPEPLAAGGPQSPPSEYPEIIPGPGLPSLAELGLTSKDLYEMAPAPDTEDEISERSTNFQATCFDKGIPGCTIADAQACVNYLTAKHNSACYVAEHSVFCATTTGCYIHGRNIGHQKSTTSSCFKAGKGAQRIVNSCKNQRGRTEGSQVANGNQNLKITIKAQA